MRATAPLDLLCGGAPKFLRNSAVVGANRGERRRTDPLIEIVARRVIDYGAAGERDAILLLRPKWFVSLGFDSS